MLLILTEKNGQNNRQKAGVNPIGTQLQDNPSNPKRAPYTLNE